MRKEVLVMRTFPGETHAWIPQEERAGGAVGERWHLYLELHLAGRRAARWADRVVQIACGALGDELAGALSVVEAAFRHVTCHMISLPAEQVTPERLEAFRRDLACELTRIEPFLLELRWPVAATGSVEADVYDPDPDQPWQTVSDLVGALIGKHFGPKAQLYDPPEPHGALLYGAKKPDGSDGFLFDSGIVQSRLRREMREGPVVVRVAALSLLKVRQDPDRSAYQWDQDSAICIPLGTGLPGLACGVLGQWLAPDAQLRADVAAIGAIGELSVDQACAAAVLGAEVADAPARLGALLDAGVLTARAGRFRLLDDPDPESLRAEAERRLVSWYLERVGAALNATGDDCLELLAVPDIAQPAAPVPAPFASFETARAWLEQERENLRALLPAALGQGLDEHCWRLCALWCGYLSAVSDFPAWRTALQVGTRAAERASSTTGRALMLEFSAKLRSQFGEHAAAAEEASKALELGAEAGDQRTRMRFLNALGLSLLRAGEMDRAAEQLVLARTEADRLGVIDFRAACRINLGALYARTGRHADAEAQLREAVDLLDPDRHLGLLADALHNLGHALRAQDRIPEALEAGRRSLAAARRTGSHTHQAMSLISLAETHAAAGSHEKALETARGACLAVRRPLDPDRIRSVYARAARIAHAAGEVELAGQLAAVEGAA
jgi:tetratricopeptide (TPR) repeat protein